MEGHIHAVEKTRISAYESLSGTVNTLNNEIKSLYNTNQHLQHTTQKLNQALRSDHTTRGKWGEIQLRRIVEITGMKEHIDFEEQIQQQHSDNNSKLRPDMIIHMPHKGIIPVDAKTPMNAYLDACNTNNKEAVRSFLGQHIKAIKGHIKTLANKQYWNLSSAYESPQLVIMFIPYESGLEAALSLDPHLLDYALANNVIISGPSSLYSLLKVISYGWMQLSLTENTKEIYHLSKELFTRFNTFYSHFSAIGKGLAGAVERFNDATNSLRGRFVPQLEKIHTLSKSNIDIPTSEQIDTIDTPPIESSKKNTIDTHTL